VSSWTVSSLERVLQNWLLGGTGLLCLMLDIREGALVEETGLLFFSDLVEETGQLSFSVLMVDSSVLYSLTITWLQGDLLTTMSLLVVAVGISVPVFRVVNIGTTMFTIGVSTCLRTASSIAEDCLVVGWLLQGCWCCRTSLFRFCSCCPSSRLAITEGALSTLVEEIGLLCFSVLTIMEEASEVVLVDPGQMSGTGSGGGGGRSYSHTLLGWTGQLSISMWAVREWASEVM
jgi:hypothetical protein